MLKLFYRNRAVTSIDKLLLTLRFYATENFLITSGDFLGVSKTTSSLIVRDVSVALVRLLPRFIKMPHTELEISTLQNRFYDIAKFSRVIGAINCKNTVFFSRDLFAIVYFNKNYFYSKEKLVTLLLLLFDDIMMNR